MEEIITGLVCEQTRLIARVCQRLHPTLCGTPCSKDLRLGDMHPALAEYRRAVMVQGLGMPVDASGGGSGGGGDRDGGAVGASESETGSRGRFIHASPDSLRMSDVSAMLAELQGALIALAPAQAGAHDQGLTPSLR